MPAEVYVRADGSDSADGSSPLLAWRTLSKLRAAINTAANGITRAFFDDRAGYLEHDDDVTFNVGANAAGITLTSYTGNHADVRPYRTLNKAELFQPDATTYPNVWATTDRSNKSTLAHLDTAASDSIFYYVRHTSLANVNAGAGRFWNPDGGPLYFSTHDGSNPASNAIMYVRSRNFGSVGDSAFEATTHCTIELLRSAFTTIAEPTTGATTPFKAYLLSAIPRNTGLLTVRYNDFSCGGKHIIGMLDGDSNHEAIIHDCRAEKGTPYDTVAGSQTPLVSYASGARTGIKHTWRRITCRYNEGVQGSTAGTIDFRDPAFYTHNEGAASQQFAELNFEHCDLRGGTITQGLVVPVVNVKGGRSYGVTGLASPAATIDGHRTDAYGVTGNAAGLNVTLRRSTLVNSIVDYSGQAQQQISGTWLVEACDIDASADPSRFNQYGVWRRGGSLNFTYRYNAGKLNSAWWHGVLADATSADTLNFAANTYQCVASGGGLNLVMVRYNDGTTTANRTFAQWQALGKDAGSNNVTATGGVKWNGAYYPAVDSPTRGIGANVGQQDAAGMIRIESGSGAHGYNASVRRRQGGRAA